MAIHGYTLRSGEPVPFWVGESRNPTGQAMMIVLAWIAASDGRVTDDELASLQEIADDSDWKHELPIAVNLATRGSIHDLQAAIEILQHFSESAGELFLELAIGVAAADGQLAVSENHILRLLADAFGITPARLSELFHESTNRTFPLPGDPSDPVWWENREAANRGKQAGSQQKENDGTRSANGSASSNGSGRRSSRAAALAILGLEEDASEAEIKEAYRLLARVHHPDRFNSLGPEAVATASVTFKRIHWAFEILTAT